MVDFALTAWLAGIRGRSIHAVFLFGLALIGIAYLAGSFSPRHPSTVVLDVGLSGIRISLVLLALFWVQDLVTQEIDRRTIFFVLTYPIPRAYFVIGRFLGILSLLATAMVIEGGLLWILVMTEAAGYQQQFPVMLGVPFWASLFAIFLDVAVVAAFAILLAVLSTVSVLPMAVGLIFAVAAKSIGPVFEYLASGAEGDATLVSRYQPVLEVAAWVVPDLSRLDWRMWPMYGVVPDTALLVLSVLMALGYMLAILALAVKALSSREFR
jgi:Cu-processing system permease protein